MNIMILKELFNQYGVLLWATASLGNIVAGADKYKYIVFCLPYNDAAVAALPDDSLIDICKKELSSKSNIVYIAIKEKFEKYSFESYDAVDSKLALHEKGISQKVLAYFAGLGWIGRSSLLITPQFGPRVRLGTIFTTNNLEVSGFPHNGNCGDCLECSQICPAGAVNESRYDVNKCKQIILDTQGAYRTFCGLCMKVCPYGKVNKTIDGV